MILPDGDASELARQVAQGADWVFVLNEDTVLAPDCLRRLV